MTSAKNNLQTVAVESAENGENINMEHVAYLMSRPAKLLSIFPEDKREAIASHVGRRSALSPALRMANRSLKR